MTGTTREPRQQCRHIFTDGHRCGSPCLRLANPGATAPHPQYEPFCYYHHTTRRPVPARHRRRRSANPPPLHLPAPEDRAAIQIALGEVLRRIALGELDQRTAGLLLYGLQIAAINLPKPAAPAPNPPGELVDEITLDPRYGHLAPTSHLVEHTATQTLLEQLATGWRTLSDQTHADPGPDLTP